MNRPEKTLFNARGAILALGLLLTASAIVAAREPKGKRKVAAEPVAAAPAVPAPAPMAIAAPETAPPPGPVAEMVEGLRAAVRSGSIEDLRLPFDWNELPPMLSAGKVDDPVAYWKKISGDGEGREILAILAKILDAGYARAPFGKDPENTAVYVWPYLAEAPLDKLTPAQEVDLLRLVAPDEARAMREKKKWTWYRLAIGADGTWHSFMRGE